MFSLPEAQASRNLHEAFFVGKRMICQRPVYWVRTNGDQDALMASHALFCPKCGEVWGRRVYLEMPNDWKVEERHCLAHGDGSLIDWKSIEGDQFLNPYYEELYPKELYDHELEILLART